MLPDRMLANEATPFDSNENGESPATSGNHSIELRFLKNGNLETATSLPSIQTQKAGRWRMLSYDESNRIAMIECDLMQQRTEHKVEFLDSNTIRLIPPNLAGLKISMEFKRVR